MIGTRAGAGREEDLKPPITQVGVLGWIKSNLFNSPLSSLVTIILLYFIWKVTPPLVRWFFIDGIWSGSADACRSADGACWAFIREKLRFILFGFYPYDEQWRPSLSVAILVFILVYSKNRAHWKMSLTKMWLLAVLAVVILMLGGVFGLTRVSYEQWGGLPLTLFLSLIAIVGAYPLGVLLAFGRRSNRPALKCF